MAKAPFKPMGWPAIFSPCATRSVTVSCVCSMPWLSRTLTSAPLRCTSPTSSAPLAMARTDSPTSTSCAVITSREAPSVCGGKSMVVLPRLIFNSGNSARSTLPSMTSSPPVVSRTCCCARLIIACSSMNMGSTASPTTTSAINAPTIKSKTSMSGAPQ